MNKYIVTFELACDYKVEAPDKETAIDIALDRWMDDVPNIIVKEIIEDE